MNIQFSCKKMKPPSTHPVLSVIIFVVLTAISVVTFFVFN